jgi:hypothetical protein
VRRLSGKTSVVAICAVTSMWTAGPGAAAAAGEWQWPVRGPVLTRYSNDDARPYAGGMHRGIDIGAAVGTPVVAARDGTVTFAGPLGSAGLTVAMRTSDGTYATSYLHLSSTAVERGETVAGGQRIGAVGTSGRRSVEQPHLHFGVRVGGSDHSYIDPLSLLPPLTPARSSPPPTPVVAPVPIRAEPAPVPIRTRPAAALVRRAPLGRTMPAPARLGRAAKAARPAPAGATSKALAPPDKLRAAAPQGPVRRARPPVDARHPARSAEPARRSTVGSDPVLDWGRLGVLAGCALLVASVLARRIGSARDLLLSALAARTSGGRASEAPASRPSRSRSAAVAR